MTSPPVGKVEWKSDANAAAIPYGLLVRHDQGVANSGGGGGRPVSLGQTIP